MKRLNASGAISMLLAMLIIALLFIFMMPMLKDFGGAGLSGTSLNKESVEEHVNKQVEEIERMIIYPSYMEITYNPLKTMGLDQASDEKGMEQKIRIDYGNLFDQLKQKQEEKIAFLCSSFRV